MPGTRPHHRRAPAIVATLAVLIALLAACAPAADRPADTLRVAIAEEVGVLDPQAFTGQFHALDLIYEPLVSYSGSGAIEPALAESWQTSPDGLTVTFRLRAGVRFHDGTVFDAAAAKLNLDRWVGEPEYSFLVAARVIESVVAADDRTLVLHLSEPYPPLLTELTLVRPVRFASPRSLAEEDFERPVGTGPWVFESADATGATFVRNDDYWGRLPSLQRVELVTVPDSQTRLSALRTGEVDLIGGAYLSPLSSTEAAELAADPELDLLTGEADTTVSLTFTGTGPAAERAVREAFSLTLDVAGLNTALYDGADSLPHGFFPASVPHSGTAVVRELDPGRAGAVLDQAGWRLDGDVRRRDGAELVLDLLVTSDPVHGAADSVLVGQAVQDAMARIGVGVRLRVVDGATHTDALAAGEHDLTFTTTYGAPYDPSGTALTYLSSAADTPVWADPTLDVLLGTALAATEDAELDGAWQAVYDHLEAEIAFVPLTSPPRRYAVRPGVEGFEVPAHEYRLDLTDVTVG